MKYKKLPIVTVKLGKIVGGGQAIGTLDDGCKIFVWGGIPGETVIVQITKKKSHLAQGFVIEAVKQGKNRIEPRDPDSYLSTSPWQIMDFDSEQNFKAALVEEAFELHNIVLPEKINIFSDNKQFEYRNKVEFSWYWNKETETLDLAFFRRGTHGKIPVNGTSLARPEINQAAIKIRDILRKNNEIMAYNLKTLLIRCDQKGNVVAQLYVKNPDFELLSDNQIKSMGIAGFELIFSNPKSPASVIDKRLQQWGAINLSDKILETDFNYATESFFQVNIPVYEQSLTDINKWILPDKPVVDLYSGVGTIGLTIDSKTVTLVEIDENAVSEMRTNIKTLGRENEASAILAPTEKALENITSDSVIIVDPPRAGLHDDVIHQLLDVSPERIIYLSCNPVTQARDIAKLSEKYGIKWHKGYNFFPRTPHIEHLVVLDIK